MVFKCDFEHCDKSYSTKGNLDEHVKVKHLHQQKAFSCGYQGCLTSFARQHTLDLHVQTVHLKQKPWACSFSGCQDSFGLKGNLARHIRDVHQNTRDFQCEYPDCQGRFSSKRNRDEHVRTVHKKDRPFSCPMDGCSQTFGLKGNLDAHIKAVHLEEKQHECDFPFCDYHTFRKSDLLRHFQTSHSEEGQQRQKIEEQKVARALTDAGIEYKREHRVSFDCWDDSFAKLDFMIVRAGCCMLLEVDERQHDWYGVECELSRMTKIQAALSIEGNTMPLVFIRYNPQGFKVDGELRKVASTNRLARLVDFITTWHCDRESGLQIQYMYYSCQRIDNKLSLDIWSDPGYNEEVRACCRHPIV